MRTHPLALAAILLVAAVSVAVADVNVTLDGKNTKVGFVGTKKNGRHVGGFNKLTGKATADKDATSLKIEAEIDVNSLFSDAAKLTGHLKSPDFFDVKKYPTAKFVSTKVEKAEGGYKVSGDLTMLGKTNAVSFAAKIDVGEKTLSVKSSPFTIKRSEWGMKYGLGMVDDDVTLTVAIDVK
jgi:polyisoprenoid-binding protein YceI